MDHSIDFYEEMKYRSFQQVNLLTFLIINRYAPIRFSSGFLYDAYLGESFRMVYNLSTESIVCHESLRHPLKW